MYTEAKYLWADGRIRFNHGEPLLGDHWPRAVIPFWCQWVKDSNLEFQPIWSRIESDDFWRAALPLVKHAEKMELLKMAAQYGNLSVFRQMNIQDVSHYASTVSTTPLTWYHIVHPTVLQWMRSKQYWNDNDIVRMMGVYSCKKDSHPSALKLFGLCEEDSPTTDFLSTWYVSLFRDFDFTPEIKANIVGSFFQTSRSKVWLDCICDGCTPYLNGVDLPLLHLAFGEDVQPDTEALTLLYTSVQSVARAEITPGLDVEPILRIAMDLQPVECALDLYHRACYAKEKILNPTPPCIELAYEY